MKPTIAPAVSPLAGPRATPTTITAATVSTENTSPDGNRNAPITWARICACARCSIAVVGRAAERRAGVVGADRLGAGDDLGDRGRASRRCARAPAS